MKGYRTVLFMSLASALPLIEVLLIIAEMREWAEIIPDGYWPYYSMLVGAMGIWLRFITTTPVGEKDEN